MDLSAILRRWREAYCVWEDAQSMVALRLWLAAATVSTVGLLILTLAVPALPAAVRLPLLLPLVGSMLAIGLFVVAVLDRYVTDASERRSGHTVRRYQEKANGLRSGRR
jgi:hypothetical protein